MVALPPLQPSLALMHVALVGLFERATLHSTPSPSLSQDSLLSPISTTNFGEIVEEEAVTVPSPLSELSGFWLQRTSLFGFLLSSHLTLASDYASAPVFPVAVLDEDLRRGFWSINSAQILFVSKNKWSVYYKFDPSEQKCTPFLPPPPSFLYFKLQ